MQSGIVAWALEQANSVRNGLGVEPLLFSDLDQAVVERLIEICREKMLYRKAELVDPDVIGVAIDFLARRHVDVLRYDPQHFGTMLTCTVDLAYAGDISSEMSAEFLFLLKAAVDESLDRYRLLKRKGPSKKNWRSPPTGTAST